MRFFGKKPLGASEMPAYYGGLWERTTTQSGLTANAYNPVVWDAAPSGFTTDGALVYPGRIGYWDYSACLYLSRSTYAAARELGLRIVVNGSILPGTYGVVWAGDFLISLQVSGQFALANAGHSCYLAPYIGGDDGWQIEASAFNWLQLSWRAPL